PQLFRKFRLYSTHNVLAGMEADWHYGIARHYLIYLSAVGLGLLTGEKWMLVSPLIGYLWRASRSFFRKSEFASTRQCLFWAGNPFRFGGVVLILLTIDMATFTGWKDAIRFRRRRTIFE
ncbi:MAG: hypothetical protein ACK559_01135, partial [bacterium]